MSDQIAQPGNGADPAAGTQTAEPGQAQPTGAQPSGGDYFAKIDSDAEFRRQELTKHQGRADRAEAQLRQLQEKLGPLGDYLNAGVDGKLLSNAIHQFNEFAKNPTGAQLLQSFQETGEVRLPNNNSGSEGSGVEDDYLTDTERQLRSELESTKQQLQEVQQMVSQTSQSFGMQSLTQQLERAFEKHQIHGDKANEVQQKVINQVQQWLQGPNAKNAIATLRDPNSMTKTVDTLIIDAMGGFPGLLDHAREVNLREGKVRSGMETDGPSLTGSTGEDESLEEASDVLTALKAARARPERLNRYSG